MTQNRAVLKYYVLAISLFSIPAAHALELDWSGQFRTEFHYIRNYTMDSSSGGQYVDTTRLTGTPPNAVPTGYYIPGGGSDNASFETLLLKLQPKVIVNDNIVVKTELWAGNPAYGLFGDSYPYTNEQRQFYSTQSRGSFITAQRFWGEFTTDFGVVTLGRAPLNWGLGLYWNSGDNLWDRFESTGDQIRLTSKFGSFTFSPGVAVYSTGNSVGGSCSFSGGSGENLCTAGQGGGGVADYFIQLKYENLEEDFEGGVNFVRRIAGGSQDAGSGTNSNPGTGPLNPTTATTPPSNPTAAGVAYNTWDLYAQKKFGSKWRLAAEVPIVSGQVAGVPYSAVAVAGEADWRINDPWEMRFRVGRAPGQPDSGGPTASTYKAYYFNPNYQIGTILFNYNFVNLGGYYGPNTLNNPTANQSNLRSPFDNPITNATYVNWTGMLHADKWTFNTGLLWAIANQTAHASDAYFYNSSKRQLEKTAPSVQDQASNLGIEWDTGAAFQWDEYFLFRLDLGMLFPGSYFKFSNSSAGPENTTSTVMAAIFRVGVNF